MSLLVLTDASSGAPTMNGVNGAMTAVLRWALPQRSWAVEYGASGNAAVFRAASGNRRRVHVNHDSAVSGSAALAVVRGCEDASSATVLVDPFPTVAQLANNAANWLTSVAANATAIPYLILVEETWFILLVNVAAGVWTMQVFGDMPGLDPADAWRTLCTTRGYTGTSMGVDFGAAQTGAALSGTGSAFWCRDVTGAVKSSRASMATSGTPLGVVPNAAPPRGGYANRIEREKVRLSCWGSAGPAPGATALVSRGFLPNIWNPLHANRGSLTEADYFTDTAYAVGSMFLVRTAQSTAWWLVETSDTWTLPSG